MRFKEVGDLEDALVIWDSLASIQTLVYCDHWKWPDYAFPFDILWTPIVRTPHIDRLATQGVRFANTYCNGALCVPSRAAMLTGQFIHRTGAWENSCSYSSETVTLAHIMRAAGYQSRLVLVTACAPHGSNLGDLMRYIS